MTAQLVLDQHPSVVHVVPPTSTIRGYRSEQTREPDPNKGLEVVSAARCQHIRAIAARLADPLGTVSPQAFTQIREIIGDLLERPPDTKFGVVPHRDASTEVVELESGADPFDGLLNRGRELVVESRRARAK